MWCGHRTGSERCSARARGVPVAGKAVYGTKEREAWVAKLPSNAQSAVLAARLDELVPKLDDQLMALTASFIREHCGLEVPIRPRT